MCYKRGNFIISCWQQALPHVLDSGHHFKWIFVYMVSGAVVGKKEHNTMAAKELAPTPKQYVTLRLSRRLWRYGMVWLVVLSVVFAVGASGIGLALYIFTTHDTAMKNAKHTEAKVTKVEKDGAWQTVHYEYTASVQNYQDVERTDDTPASLKVAYDPSDPIRTFVEGSENEELEIAWVMGIIGVICISLLPTIAVAVLRNARQQDTADTSTSA